MKYFLMLSFLGLIYWVQGHHLIPKTNWECTAYETELDFLGIPERKCLVYKWYTNELEEE